MHAPTSYVATKTGRDIHLQSSYLSLPPSGQINNRGDALSLPSPPSFPPPSPPARKQGRDTTCFHIINFIN